MEGTLGSACMNICNVQYLVFVTSDRYGHGWILLLVGRSYHIGLYL
jgi:hypothetical protein